MFHMQFNQLFCENVPLADLVNEVGTPTYVYSQSALLTRAAAYQSQGAENALVCFAVKANGNPALLRLMAQAGLGADVTSGGELFLALHAGFAPEKILFSGVGKTAVDIHAALDAHIHGLHIESAMEFALIAEIAKQRQQVVPIAVRVNPNIPAETHPYISTGQKSHKFGVSPDIAMHLLRQAKNNAWLNPMGIAAHIGSQIVDVAPYLDAAHFLLEMAQTLSAQGIQLQYVDVGGGLGIDYEGKTVPQIEEWVTAVSTPIHAAGYDVILEPGRSIVGPVGTLITKVLYTKQQGDKQFVIADAGMNDLLRPTLYQAYHPIVPLRQSDEPTTVVDIVGPVCESGDWLAKERPLPPQHPGDYLAIMHAGAYGFAMSSNYNGRLRPAEILVNDTQYHIIRQRQTNQDLLLGTI
ncbi:MAG: diaminopimelate decarboxylase [Chloroflexi bacterium]|nr:diaminopimelate decarboxylase [Chloroflexota bacterium]